MIRIRMNNRKDGLELKEEIDNFLSLYYPLASARYSHRVIFIEDASDSHDILEDLIADGYLDPTIHDYEIGE